MSNVLRYLVSGYVFLLLASCGGGGSNNAPASTTPTAATTTTLAVSAKTGVFIDSAVGGLAYTTATQSGMTNANGEFSYIDGESIVFNIGSIEFPSVTAAPQISPLYIFNTSDFNNTQVTNLARLLQSLDIDATPSNGISIASTAHTSAIGLIVDFSSPTFDTDVNNLIANSGSSNTKMIPANDAITHLTASLNGSSVGQEPIDFSITLSTATPTSFQSSFQKEVYLVAATEYFFTVAPTENSSMFDFSSQRISLTSDDISTRIDHGIHDEYWGDQQAYSELDTFRGLSELAFMPTSTGFYTLTFRGSNDITFANPPVSKTFNVTVRKDTTVKPGYGNGFVVTLAGVITFTGILQSPLDQDVFKYTLGSVLGELDFGIGVSPDTGAQGFLSRIETYFVSSPTKPDLPTSILTGPNFSHGIHQNTVEDGSTGYLRIAYNLKTFDPNDSFPKAYTVTITPF